MPILGTPNVSSVHRAVVEHARLAQAEVSELKQSRSLLESHLGEMTGQLCEARNRIFELEQQHLKQLQSHIDSTRSILDSLVSSVDDLKSKRSADTLTIEHLRAALTERTQEIKEFAVRHESLYDTSHFLFVISG